MDKNKIIGVVGSRTFFDYNLLKKTLDEASPKMLVSGGADGADTLAEKYAKQKGLSILIHFPDWSNGKGAAFDRNSKIVDSCEILLAFWDGKSRGTLDSMNKAKALNKPVYVVRFKAT
jgi:hypothetical protein